MIIWDWLIPLLAWLVGIPTALLLQRLGHKIWPPKGQVRYITESEQFKSEGKYPENLQNIISSNENIKVETHKVGTQIIVIIPTTLVGKPNKSEEESETGSG